MKIKKFDVVNFLDSDEAIIEYLNAALEEGDSDFFVKAVGDIARAKGRYIYEQARQTNY